MRLSTVFELLLILLLVAFAAYGRVIDHDEITHRVTRAADNTKQNDMGLSTMSLKQATDSVNRYCTCNENICNCCRDFHIPVVQLKGPGCASLQYLQGDNLAVQLSFGDNILTSTIVNGKNPKPVCVPLPGGFTKFCGRIYSIQRDAKNHFKACLGLELQSATELEASLRVSCFRFGPEGLKLRPAEPLPVVEAESEEDDDDDFFGLGSDDDDDDDDDEDDTRPSFNSVPDASGVNEAQESDDDDDDDDLLGFSALLDIFTGDDDTATKKPKVTTVAPLLEFTIPILSRPTTPGSLGDPELPTFSDNESENNNEEHENSTQEPGKVVDEENIGATESNIENNTDQNQEQVTEASNKVTYVAKPNKATINKVKKGEKKPSVTSTSVNAIHDPEKPAKKPIKDEYEEDDDDDDILDDDDDEGNDDDDDEVLDDDDEDKIDEDEDNEDKLDDEKHEEHYDDDDDDEKAEDLAELDDDDDDDEDEEAILSALMDTGKSKKNKGNETSQTNVDYAELDFLTKKHVDGNRQSKLTRF
ncbi:uncharacterized protein [Anoplolepis gracilipes]|uniref:uncharacterized protein n=1 Tax=Anoplolepis gracilipes TaxID=354296 RepID=UPI003BA098AF